MNIEKIVRKEVRDYLDNHYPQTNKEDISEVPTFAVMYEISFDGKRPQIQIMCGVPAYTAEDAEFEVVDWYRKNCKFFGTSMEDFQIKTISAEMEYLDTPYYNKV